MRISPQEMIKCLKQNKFNVSKTADELGVHRSTIYRWKFRSTSILGYVRQRVYRKSTQPHTIHKSMTPDEERDIIRLRARVGYTAEKLRYLLKIKASVRSVERLLKRAGVTHKYGNHRRPYYQQTTHMHLKNAIAIGYLQMDVKYLTPELTGLPWTCYEYAIIDIYSRYKDAVILNTLDASQAVSALFTMLKRLPFKAVFIQTDNGLEYQGIFNETLEKIHLKHHFIHKRTPNENAVIERSFRTDEEEFFFFRYKGARDYDDLRNQFALYLKEYNEKRPHLGLSLKTPLEVIQLSQMS